ELDRYVHAQIEKHTAGAVDWIQRQSPLWRTVGRVTFHLAENKRDETRPFAFMATYTDKVSAGAKPVQLPLSKALTEYASARDRNALLRLLQPITAAAEKCSWVQEMVDDQTVYQPRAWSPKQAYQLLQDIPALEEAGLIVRVPDWWKGKQTARPQVRVNIGTENNTSSLGIDSILQFRIETVLNGEPLSKEELARLLTFDGSLVRLRGEWVEVDRAKLQAALDHWQKIDKLVHEDGLSFYEGMRLLSGLPVDGKWDGLDKELSFRDWSEVMPIGSFAEALAAIRDPSQAGTELSFQKLGLNATLRPYQETGVHWLHLLTRLGLGACLADDMGLGKTIQVIALLLALKQTQTSTSLLVAPASLLGNWESEIQKFAPSLRTRIAHAAGAGTDKPENLHDIDLVMTTYGMVERIDWIKKQHWRNIILDEAQAIKNAGTKQAKAVKELNTAGRIVLTGTPIENRLSDLWSLFDFLNPGLLGSNAAFSKFVKSLSKNTESVNYAPLRKLTQPYILRRLKTDKKIISDLPDKTEVTAWCGLSKNQAAIYAQSVKQLEKELRELREDKGNMKRRGLILAYLMRFKQICNHPAQWTGDGDFDPMRSGKFERLREICDEIASRQEKVLIFSQFREITEPLSHYLQTIFKRPGLILDGTTAIKKRKEMVDAFQTEAGPPFFVLSLKAGGTGLNLTAASHVVHFDRWWNPAVENQATDRAFRIGQRKNVLVHKFVCRGTIEERIDDLIESKKSLAKEIVEGGGETLVTEMSDEQLLKMVTLDINKAQEN
ncbi:MAG: DEAD/DEAH box helicase, partial [Planctomycetaceae bacterium]|nr:DEAD/DEAH box helicase [Planctomycetaceae bacterium]